MAAPAQSSSLEQSPQGEQELSLEEKEARLAERGADALSRKAELQEASRTEAADFAESSEVQLKNTETRYGEGATPQEAGEAQQLAQESNVIYVDFKNKTELIAGTEAPASPPASESALDDFYKSTTSIKKHELPEPGKPVEQMTEDEMHAEYERLGKAVAEQGAAESKMMKKALNKRDPGYAAPTTEAAFRMNEIFKRLGRMSANESKKAAEAAKPGSPRDRLLKQLEEMNKKAAEEAAGTQATESVPQAAADDEPYAEYSVTPGESETAEKPTMPLDQALAELEAESAVEATQAASKKAAPKAETAEEALARMEAGREKLLLREAELEGMVELADDVASGKLKKTDLSAAQMLWLEKPGELENAREELQNIREARELAGKQVAARKPKAEKTSAAVSEPVAEALASPVETAESSAEATAPAPEEKPSQEAGEKKPETGEAILAKLETETDAIAQEMIAQERAGRGVPLALVKEIQGLSPAALTARLVEMKKIGVDQKKTLDVLPNELTGLRDSLAKLVSKYARKKGK